MNYETTREEKKAMFRNDCANAETALDAKVRSFEKSDPSLQVKKGTSKTLPTWNFQFNDPDELLDWYNPSFTVTLEESDDWKHPGELRIRISSEDAFVGMSVKRKYNKSIKTLPSALESLDTLLSRMKQYVESLRAQKSAAKRLKELKDNELSFIPEDISLHGYLHKLSDGDYKINLDLKLSLDEVRRLYDFLKSLNTPPRMLQH